VNGGHDLAAAVSAFGAETRRKLANRAASGALEDQLRAPLETLVADLARLTGLPRRAVALVGDAQISLIFDPRRRGCAGRPAVPAAVHRTWAAGV